MTDGRRAAGGPSLRWLPWVAALIGALLATPTLSRGLKMDDLIQRRLLVGPEAVGLGDALLGFFSFMTPEDVGPWRAQGLLPWWTDEGVRIAFLRPVTVLTHWLDHRLWPDSVVAMHAHSIAWLAACCAIAACLYRRFLPARAAVVAAVLLALDDAHAIPTEWIANRNALVAFALGMLALDLHDRRRRLGDPRAVLAVLAPLCFALSLLAAEAGAATGAFLAAHAVCLDRGSIGTRLRALLPYVAIGVVWRVAYSALGYGAAHTGLYVDPGADPGRFLAAALERGPVLLASAFGGIEPFLSVLANEGTRRGFWLVCVVGLALLAAAFAPLARREPVLRFLLLGSALAIVPSCGMSMPGSRLTVFAGFGALGAVGMLVDALLARTWVPGGGCVARSIGAAVGVALVLANGVLAPLTFLALTAGPDKYRASIEQRADVGLPPDGRDVVVLNAPNPFDALYAPLLQEAGWGERRMDVLAPGYQPLEVERTGAAELRLRPAAGFAPDRASFEALSPPPIGWASFFSMLDRTFRAEDPSPAGVARAGAVERIGPLAILLADVGDDGSIREVRVRFEAPLEELAVAWRAWSWAEERFVPFAPPAVGETVLVDGPPDDAGKRSGW